MKQKFKNLATVMQRQILIRLVLGGVFIFLFVILMCVSKDIIISLPCLVLGAYLVANGGIVLYNCFTDKVVTVTGKCIEIEHSLIFKRVKSIYIQNKDKEFKVPVRKKLKGLTIGVTLNLYIPKKARVYENDSKLFVGTYYAVEIDKAFRLM